MKKLLLATVITATAYASTLNAADAETVYYTCGSHIPGKQVIFVNLVDNKRLEMQVRDGDSYNFAMTRDGHYRRGYFQGSILLFGSTRYKCDKNPYQPDSP
jgi:hypothetical protein